ncbi:MAG: hypothetical protein IJY01_00910 [Clostridia bacterium]|nr:hypothetical protein [Clostridia bacterium]
MRTKYEVYGCRCRQSARCTGTDAYRVRSVHGGTKAPPYGANLPRQQAFHAR